MTRRVCGIVWWLLLLGAVASASDPAVISRNLYSHSASVRKQAADQLVAIGPSAVPALVAVVCKRANPNFDEAWPVAAKALGQLKSGEAAGCLVNLLMYRYPAIGPVVMKSDQTLADVDPAFASLVQIGDPAVPAVRSHLPGLGPQEALMALRVLRAINSPSSKAAADAYVKMLEDQLRFSKEILEDFSKG